MKNKIIKVVKDPKLVGAAAVIVSILLLILIAPSVLYPRFISWRDLVADNDQESKRLSNITSNVNTLVAVDATNLSEYENLIDKILPNEQDKLRVTSILDILVGQSGMKLISLKVITKTTGQESTSTQNTGPTSAAPPTPPSSSTPTTGISNTPDANITPTLSDKYEVSVVMQGSLSKAVKFLDFLDRIKRSVKVLSLSVVKEENDDGVITDAVQISVDFEIPLNSNILAPSPEEQIDLSKANEDILQDLINKLNIDASPTNNPTGRSDPFK